MALITLLVWPPSVAALLRAQTTAAAYPYGGSPFGGWGVASQKWMASRYSSSPFQPTQTKLCIDFGSSGAKFMDCTDPDPNKVVKYEDKFFDGAGAFSRMTLSNNLDNELADYLKAEKKVIDKSELRMCGGTAGNRFKDLAAKNDEGWEKFNQLLKKFNVTIPQGKECKTLPGTEEALLEWTLSKLAYVFVGIGGASMQLRIPADRGCPNLEEGSEFDGGVGARTQADYCKSNRGGQLWSFLADGKRAEGACDSKHIVGGMDEVAKKMYQKIQETILTRVNEATVTDLQWVNSATHATVLADPMWKVMLQQMHPTTSTGCTRISKFTLLSGAARGRKLFGAQSLGQTMPTLDAASLTDSRQMLFYFLSLADGQFDGMATKVRDQCKAAVAKHGGVDDITDQKIAYTTFKDDAGTINEGFVCMSNLFHYSWITTFAGYKANGVADQCAMDNIQGIINGDQVEGDWMSGALMQQQ